ncbi:membrane protein [Marinithermofilum abyssi]|uniref:Membrane protein n=1 Tax=Marinithermofilum abyssi TaxID=1571185 RepID=A0A8J2YE39_9BACL|nr:DMT family transporter [Marinithermofilum abyssi]GGE23980.1 membrane protein [Marinithermofilum abyssi]
MSKRVVYIVMTLNMLVWGLNTIAIKILVQYFPPVTMQAMRIMLAGVELSLLVLFRREWRKLTTLEWKYVTGAVLFGVVGHHSFLAAGLADTTATNGSLILALLPLSTALLSAVFLHDRLTLFRTLGIFSGLTGVAFVVLTGNEGASGVTSGDVLVFFAMLAQAISFLFIKKATDTMDPKHLTAVMFLLGSTGILVTSFLFYPHPLDLSGASPAAWILLIASALIATGLGHMVYNFTIRRLGAGQTAIFINMTPFFSLIGSAWFLGEKILPSHVVGFIMIVAGVILGSGAVEEKWRTRQEVTKSKEMPHARP